MIKVAIIGLGWWGSTILKTLLNSPVVNPVLGVDPHEPARAAASALGVKTAPRFEDALANPESRRSSSARRSSIMPSRSWRRHSRDVTCFAKSRCARPRPMREAAIAAVKKAGVQLGIGHERRFEPAVIDMRQRFAAGEFGTPLLLEGNFSQDKFLNIAAR